MIEWLKNKKVHKTQKKATITAASATITSRDKNARAIIRETPWQTIAWRATRQIPEVGYGVRWKSNSVSRARLYAGIPDSDGTGNPIPSDNALAQSIMEQLFQGFSGQTQMLRRVATLLEVAGEAYIVGVQGLNPDNPSTIRWTVTNNNNLTRDPNGLSIQLEVEGPRYPLRDDNSTIIRIWNPDGENELHPDSSVRSILPVYHQMIKLDRHINATAESRYAGNGMLVVPEGATTSAPQRGEGNTETGDPFIEDLIDAMTIPIQDEDSAAGVVPIVVKVPTGVEGQFQYLTFSTPFDDRILDLRESDIRRIGVGMDIPVEVLTGMGSGSNHWSAWLISEDAVKLNIEPVLELICQVLTEQYLRPLLRAAGDPTADDHIVWYDSSELTLRPNQGPEAREVFQLGGLSAEALRRYSGFSEDDAPSPAEQLTRLLVAIVTASPELAPSLIPQIERALTGKTEPITIAPIADIPQIASPADSGSRSEIPTMVASTRLAESPTRIMNNGQCEIAEMSALRALERVGNFLMRGQGKPYRKKLNHIPSWELHTMLTAAPDEYNKILAGAYVTLEAAVPDSPCLVETVDTYVRTLIASKKPHQRDELVKALVASGCVGDERG